MNRSDQPIEALLDEERLFPPPEECSRNANIADPEIYQRAAKDPEAYWAQAAESLEWIRKWDRVLDWKPPIAQWFVGGKLNVSVNCLDRHVRGWRRNKAAFIWEGEPGEERVLTFADLYREVNRFANAMKRLGVQKGDRVTIYMPMIPELPIALLACARIGAPHSVVFGGFSAESLRDRINDAQSKLVITADGSYRRGQIVPLKRNVDAALKDCPCVEKVVMVRRIGDAASVDVDESRDVWWHRVVENVPAWCEPEPMDSEDPLFILYTSGTTAKPKGILHTTGGYILGASLTHKWVFDAKEEDVYWCSADIGWVTGHSYIVYGPLANGTTGVLYEGSPDWPDKDRWWAMVAKYGVNVFYTAPTAHPGGHEVGRVLPGQARPFHPAPFGDGGRAHQPRGLDVVPREDRAGALPHRGHLVADRNRLHHDLASAGSHHHQAGFSHLSPAGHRCGRGGRGRQQRSPGGRRLPGAQVSLALHGPHHLWRPKRYEETYWQRFGKNVYFAGDGCKRDEEGYFWLLGRVDDVMNISGHRLSTMEVESALVDHQEVAEAAVIGKQDDIKGEAIAAFVTLKEGAEGNAGKVDELKKHVVRKIGPIARPQSVYFTAELPKTRSGKIMRRLLRDIAEGRALGDTTTLADATVVAKLKSQYEEG